MIINDVCRPNNAELKPKRSTQMISQNLPTNSATHEIIPSSLGLTQSEMYLDITGRIRERPNDIPKLIVMIFQNHSLNHKRT